MIKDMLSIYRMAELLPSSETIERRTAATSSFVEWLDSQDTEAIAISVELALHQPMGNDLKAAPIKHLMEELVNADPEFSNDPFEVSMCLRACLIAALDELINTSSSNSAKNIAALCVAGYSSFSLPKESRLIASHVKNLYHSSIIFLEKSGLTMRGVSFTKEPSKTQTLVNLAEEVDVLWWVENSFSVATKSPYTDLDECEIPFWLAHDLSSLVRAPATQGTRNLLAKQSSRLSQNSYTWRQISDSVVRTLRTLDCTPFDLPDITSSHMRLFPALATTIGRVETQNTSLPLSFQQTGPEWSIHIFNEILATKILAEETAA